MIADIDNEHHDEETDRGEQAAIVMDDDGEDRSCRLFLVIDIECRLDDRALIKMLAFQFPRDAAAIHDENAVAAADQFGIVCGVEEHRHSFVRKVPKQLVDFLFGTNINTARWDH